MECKCGNDIFVQDRGIMEEGYVVEYNEVCVNCNAVVGNWSYGHYTVYEENLMPVKTEFEIEVSFVDGSIHTIYVDAWDKEEALEYAKVIDFKIYT